ncbi:MAG TPA: ClbS/DfsB family four-helix bundle protein [Blastocatellia bacterium]|jgi:hypothetical protein|nr:ClbS/DfsB family four-helix bundle protein [Blastocatellia bacterium]
MGKRLPKQQLLAEIEQQRTALDQTIAVIPERLITKTGVTRGGWSVKDVLGHLVEWQQMNLDWYAAGQRGEKPAMPAPGFTLRELPRLNQMIYRKHHRRPLRAVLEDYHSSHARIIALIETLSDSDLVTLGRWSWTGPSWTLSDYLRASTSAHYLWARTRIRRWWKRHGRAQEMQKSPSRSR